MPRAIRPIELVRRYWRHYALGGASLVVTNLCDTALPLILKVAIDDIVIARGVLPLWAVAALYLGLVLFLGLYRYFWRYWFLGASHRIATELRARLFHHLERLTPAYFQGQRTGDLMSRATNDVQAVRMFYAIGLLLTLDTVMYLVIIPPMMIWLAPELALYTLLPLVGIPYFVYRMGKVIHARYGRVQERFGDMAAAVEETATGIRVVKGFAQEEARERTFLGLNERYVGENMRLQIAQGLAHPTISLLMAVTLVIVIVAGGKMTMAGVITVGSFVAFQDYLLKLAWPMRAVGFTVNIYQRGLASMERLDEVLQTAPVIEDGPDTLRDAEVREGRVEVRGLTFRYPRPGTAGDATGVAAGAGAGVGAGAGAAPDAGAAEAPGAVAANTEREPALQAISLRVAAGETVALVGPVGSGKSTLLQLLPRLFEAPPGTLSIDGLDIRRYRVAALRAALGYVPQETFLFADSVGANIAFGVPDADEAAIREAAARAGILDEIEALPEGFASRLGERGVDLSGGQRQRIAIARAIIRKPRILLLDDCLSAVDTETEAAILKGLRLERQGRTTLIASHRLAAVRDADRIVCLERGRIVEEGTHEALLEAGGLYASLWERHQLERTLELG